MRKENVIFKINQKQIHNFVSCTSVLPETYKHYNKKQQ